MAKLSAKLLSIRISENCKVTNAYLFPVNEALFLEYTNNNDKTEYVAIVANEIVELVGTNTLTLSAFNLTAYHCHIYSWTSEFELLLRNSNTAENMRNKFQSIECSKCFIMRRKSQNLKRV